ncbi:GPI-linked NAD(P)(+)--arginine ADP-ribosyltransferase 1 isoform X3 [Pogona vitticeps]
MKRMQAMKRPLLAALLLLCLMGIFPAGPQISSFPVQRRDLLSIKEFPLDMAPNSFDDQYKCCVEMMEAEVEELNRTEFATNRVYAEAWEKAASKWQERKSSVMVPDGLKPEHAIAIMAYTLAEENLYRDFNRAVREAGRTRDSYLNDFHFKTFHFLLTRALLLLGTTSAPRCQKVYRGVRNIHFVPKHLEDTRFGQFTSSSLKYEIAQEFGTDTSFAIETCHGVNIENFSFFPEQKEVLIPPFEKFKVANFTKAPEMTFIQLVSAGNFSLHNCVFVKGAGPSHLSATKQMPFLLWGAFLAVMAFNSPGAP